MHVCNVYLHINTHLYMHTMVFIPMFRTDNYMHTHSCMFAYIQTYLYEYNIYVCMHSYHTYIHTDSCMSVYIHMYKYTCIPSCISGSLSLSLEHICMCAVMYVHAYIYVCLQTYIIKEIMEMRKLRNHLCICVYTYHSYVT